MRESYYPTHKAYLSLYSASNALALAICIHNISSAQTGYPEYDRKEWSVDFTGL